METREIKRYRLIRFSIGLFIFIILVLVTAFLFRPLQIELQNRMAAFRDSLIGRAETLLAMRIEYGSMGPSIFGTLDIRNIRIYRDEQLSAGISRLRVSYSFIKLLRGDVLESLHSVRIDKPALTLDLTDASWLSGIRLPSDLPGIEAVLREFRHLSRAFTIRVRGGECALLQGKNTFSLKGVSLDTSILGGQITVKGKVGARASIAAVLKEPLSIGMTGRINGMVSDDFEDGSFSIQIPSLWGDSFKFQAVSFTLGLKEKTLELRKANDALPFDLLLNYAYDSGYLSAEFRSRDFSLRQILSFSGLWRNYSPLLDLTNSGYLAFSAEKTGHITYNADFSGNFNPDPAIGEIGYAIAAQGDEESVTFHRLSFQFPRGTLAYTGDLHLKPLAPNGTISISDLSLTGDGLVNGELSLSAEGRDISVFSENLSLGTVLLSGLDADFVREDRGLAFVLSALRFTGMESWEDVRLSRFVIDGFYETDPRHLQASLVLDTYSAADLLNMARPFIAIPDFSPITGKIIEDISVTTEIFVTTDFEQLLYNAPRSVVAYEGKQEIFALASISGTDRRFDLNEIQVVSAGSGIDATGYVDFSNSNDIHFSLRGSYSDLSYYFEGLILDRRSISIQGSYGLSVYIGMTNTGGYSGYIETRSVPIPWKGQLALFAVRSFLRFDSPASWSVDIDHLELSNLTTPASSETILRVSGGADQDGLLLRELFFDDGRGLLSGGASAVWNSDFSLINGQLTMTDQAGTERYSIGGIYDAAGLDLSFSGDRMQLSRVFWNSYNIVASGNLRLRWNSWDSYWIQARIPTLSARIGEKECSASVSAYIDAEEIRVENVAVNYGGFRVEIPFIRVNQRDSLIRTAGRVWGAAAGRDIDMAIAGDVGFRPIDSWLDIPEALESFNGNLRIDSVRIDAEELQAPFMFTFARADSLLSLSGGPNNMIRFRFSDEGDFYMGLSYPSPVRGSLVGVISADTIDAQISDLYVDLASLWRFIPPQNIINCTGGFVTASIQIRGPLGDPEFFGTARGTSVRLEVPAYLRAEIGPTPMEVILEGNEMRFGPLLAPVGTGIGEVTAWFQFDRWIPSTFNLDIRAWPEDPLPFGFDILGIVAQGLVSGRLNLAQEDMILRITGDLTGYDTEITLDAQELAAGEYRTVSTANDQVLTDIIIRTGRKVEFLWPTADFPILRAHADLGTDVRVISDSVSGRFSLIGDVDLRSGELFYFQRSFYIREGVLSFNENEIQFNPRLTARAEIRDRTDDGPVTISMIVDNAPLLSFTARFESTPPLSQFEILSLLGQNMTNASAERGSDSWAFFNSLADMGAQFQLIRRMERTVRDFIGLDMFSVRTQVLQNALLQFTGIRDPVDRIGRVGNYFDNTTVFLGKYIGADMFAQVMLSTRYNENKIDWWGIELEGDIGIELRGPLFDIRWNVIPLHPENLFIDDVSFTLTWRRSF